MDLLYSFQQAFSNHALSGERHRYILACSGGLDSTVLVDLCLRAGIKPHLAHVNYGLRGKESERDANFVRAMADQYNLPFTIYEPEFDKGPGLQERARDERYRFFHQLMANGRFDLTLLAHQQDDQIETMLMNFFRGTGLAGLTGMPQIDHQRKLFRPLLGFSREALHAYALERELNWVEDSSNEKTDYTRNKLRHLIIPSLKELFPGFRQAMSGNLERFQSIEAYYRLGINENLRKLGFLTGADFQVPVLQLEKLKHTSLPFELLHAFGGGFKQLPDFLHLLEAQSGKYLQIGEKRIVRHRRWLVFSYRAEEAALQSFAEPGTYESPYGLFEIRSLSSALITDNSWTAVLDARDIAFPLTLRPRKPGDYFYPLGMPHKKKVARFLIDQKISAIEKEKVLVLESAGRILWLPGLRIDHRFRALPSSKNLLVITLKQNLL